MPLPRSIGSRARPGLPAALLAVVALASAAPALADGATAQRIRVDGSSCAAGWTAPNPGHRTFRLVNATDRPAAIVLLQPRSGKVSARVSPLPAHGRRALRVRLTPGVYAWQCTLRGRAAITSEVARVPIDPVRGRPVGRPSFPVAWDELGPPLTAYRSYAEAQLAAMGTSVAVLQARIAAGDLAGARAAWLPARLAWERVGAAYGALGAIGKAISTTTAGLNGGVNDPAFTGLHRVEYDLWITGELSAAGHDSAVLAATVARLAAGFPTRPLPRTDLPLRAHEILEDALRDELTGRDDYGSGASAAAVDADVDATRAVLGFLADLIEPRSPGLVAKADRQLDTLSAALEATRVDGNWVAITQVPLAGRQRVNAAIGAVLETLAPVPDILTTGAS